MGEIIIINTGILQDKLEIYSIDPSGNWTLEMETTYKTSVFDKITGLFHRKPCINDALTNYAINDIAQHISGKYGYASVGTSDTDPTDYSRNSLISPVMNRFTTANTLVNTYGSDSLLPDTAQFTVIVTSDGDYDLIEFGLHTTAVDGYMGARQVGSAAWTVSNNETFGLIWKVISGRG
jgi:hypothetical protein